MIQIFTSTFSNIITEWDEEQLIIKREDAE